jgi:polysaccharide biosynthesis transport protein
MSVELQTKPQETQPADSSIHRLPVAGERFTVMELWRVIMKRRYVIATVTVLSLAGALWYALRTAPVFESSSHIEIRPQDQPDIGLQQVVGAKGGDEAESPLSTEVHILQSDSVLFQTAESLNLIEVIRARETAAARKNNQPGPTPGAPISAPERDAMIAMVRSGLKVNIVTGTDIVEIHYRSGNPQLAAALVNRLVDTYSDVNLRSKYDRTMYVSTWLQKQLDGLRSEASDAQRALADYQKAHNIVGTDQNSNLAIQTLQGLSSSLDQAETDRITKEARMRDFNSMGPNLVAVMGDNPILISLRSQLADLQTQQAQLSSRYGPKYPKMIDLAAQINRVQTQIDAEVALARRQVTNEYQGALGVEHSLRQRLVAQEDVVYKLNEGGAQYAILQNQAELTRELYDTLQMRLKEAMVTAGLSAANITVVDSAQVPYVPVAPQKERSIMMGLLGGLFGGCVLAFLIESIDDRLQTSDEVEGAALLPPLAAIPHLAGGMEKQRVWGKKKLDSTAVRLNQHLVALRDSKSSSAEAYRNLRSSLLLSFIDNPPRIIVVTSALPEEGKTTTAINTAIVLAQRGEKVLLVDGDLRRGCLGAVFGLSDRTFGLSTVLASPNILHEIAVPLPELPTLHVLPNGPRPPNPAEMLSSSRMEEQFRHWLEEYDRIVIDSAPLLSVSDTQAIAVFVDAVVLVTRAGMTRKRALVRARDILLRINAPIAGVVVNDVDVRLENFYTHRYGMYGYGYGYGGNYDRAYGYDEKDEETR